MKLCKGVFYQRVGDYTVLRHTLQKKDYVFNDTVYDILSLIRQHSCTEAELLASLRTVYDVDDEDAFEGDIHCFLEELTDNEIIESDQHDKTEDPLEQIRAYCRENHILYSVSLELTYRCNERCIHCYIDEQPSPTLELTTEEYKNLLREIREMGCMMLHLTGGEVTLRKDFFEIVEYAAGLGFCIDVYSNGYSVTDEQIQRLADLRINSLSFSFYSGNPEIHDSITQVKGSFKCSLHSMIVCKCLGIDTYIKTVVMKQNIDSYESLYQLGKLYDVEVVPSMAISNTHQGQSSDKFRLLSPELYQRAVEIRARYYPDELVIPAPNSFDRRLCGAGRSAISIDPYGEVFPCNAFPISLGNVRAGGLRKVWENNSFSDTLYQLCPKDLCRDIEQCKYRDYCSMCPGCFFDKNNGSFSPSQESCMIAEGNYRAANKKGDALK